MVASLWFNDSFKCIICCIYRSNIGKLLIHWHLPRIYFKFYTKIWVIVDAYVIHYGLNTTCRKGPRGCDNWWLNCFYQPSTCTQFPGICFQVFFFRHNKKDRQMGLLQIIECKNIIFVLFEKISPLKKKSPDMNWPLPFCLALQIYVECQYVKSCFAFPHKQNHVCFFNVDFNTG